MLYYATDLVSVQVQMKDLVISSAAYISTAHYFFSILLERNRTYLYTD